MAAPVARRRSDFTSAPVKLDIVGWIAKRVGRFLFLCPYSLSVNVQHMVVLVAMLVESSIVGLRSERAKSVKEIGEDFVIVSWL